MPMKVSSFPAEFLQLLIAASQGTVKFSMPYKEAVNRRQWLYRLRAAMQREQHPSYNAVASVVIRLNPNKPASKDDRVELIAEPRDSDFVGLIRKEVGEIKPPEISDREVEDIFTTTQTEADEPVDPLSFFDDEEE